MTGQSEYSFARTAQVAFLVFAAYYVGALLSFALRVPSTRSSIIWAPNAVLLAAFVATPPRTWWLWVIASLPAHLLAQARDSGHILLLLCPFLANVAQAGLGALALCRYCEAPHRLETFRDMAVFVLAAVIVAPAVVSFTAAWLFVAAGWETDYWLVAEARFLNNVTTGLSVAPILLALAVGGLETLRRLPVRRYVEFFLLLIMLAGIISIASAWTVSHSTRLPLQLYSPLPFLIWAAVRFGPSGLSLTILVVASHSISDAIAGRGPFVSGTPAENVLSLELSLAVLSLPLMFLAALIRERTNKDQLVRESEDRFRSMADTAPVMIWVSGRDKLCTFFNKGWLEFRGRTLEQEAGNGWVEGVHPQDADRCRNTYITAFDARRDYSVEYRLKRHDGEYRWILQSGVPRLAPDGEFLGYIGCAIDIAERKLAEEAVQKSEAKFSGILSIAADAIISVDESQRITLFNEGAEKIFGYSKTEALGQSLDLLIPEKFRANYTEHVRAFASSATPARQIGDRQEIFGLRKGGEIFPAEASISRLEMEGQKIFTVVLRDITRRIAIEEALRASEARLLLAMDAARIGYWEVDLSTGKVIRSESLERIFGLPPGSLPPDQEAFFALVHPEDVARLRHRAQEMPDQIRESANIEYRILRPDGTVRWIASRGQRMFGADGKLTRISGLSIDVTERKQAEEALREALEEVRQLKVQVEEENVYLRKEVSEAHRYGEIVGRSEKIAGIVFQAEQVASTDMTVLIVGETGTGKELVARAVHAKSARRGRPLVKVNCAALPEPLIESELFGHEKGAFTGASGRQVGRFELADGGTIFLDEIGDLPLGLQAKLLRVLQEGEFERLGSSKTVKVDVRVIAATNRDLTQAMQRGSFRSDLYYRLNVYPIQVPTLREHKEDIGELAELFLAEAGRRLGRRFEAIPAGILEVLQSYDWPGNVRELQNVIERAAVTTLGRVLTLPQGWDLRAAEIARKEPGIVGVGETPPISDRAITLEDLERAHILRVLLETRWRIGGPKGAATRLGLHPSTLRSRMTKLGIGRHLVS